MADDETKYSGRFALETAWWAAINELLEIIESSEDASKRIEACAAVLQYCSTLNVGIGEPFLPEAITSDDEDKDDDDD